MKGQEDRVEDKKAALSIIGGLAFLEEIESLVQKRKEKRKRKSSITEYYIKVKV